MQKNYAFYLLCCLLGLWSCQPAATGPLSPAYSPDWTSLATHEKAPAWFADAKLGIYFHWGVYSVPAFSSEWYPRWMYVPGRKKWGAGSFEYHEKTFGHPSEFNYHDFVPMFKAEEYDPAEWAELFQQSGARFAGPVAQHHDGFAMWESEVNPWNAGAKGPQRDILGELFVELKKRDMKTIATFHHARTLQRYARDTANWIKGSDSHFPYHPDYATSSTDPELKYLYGNLEEGEFYDYWLAEVDEVVEKYSPDIIWFDSWLDRMPETYRQRMVANHFNAGSKRDQEVVVAYKQEDLPRNIGVLDIEQGGMKELSPDYWLTDVTLSHTSWCYIQDQTYKTPDLLLRNMIDVWSKKGIVLLNVSPRADGVIPDAQRAVLADMGEWLKTHAKAVYGTRTHHLYGYGPAAIEEGHFGGQAATIQYTAADIRFTTSADQKHLYAFSLGLPEAETEIKIESVFPEGTNGSIKSVKLLSAQEDLEWRQEGTSLLLMTPSADKMNTIATVFDIEFN